MKKIERGTDRKMPITRRRKSPRKMIGTARRKGIEI